MGLARLEVLFCFVMVWDTAFCNRFTFFFYQLCPWWRSYQRFIIFIFRNNRTIWTNKRFIVIIFIKFSCGSWICWFLLRAQVTCLFGWGDRSLDFGWYARLLKSKTICPRGKYSAGEECKPKAGHVILSPFGSNSIVIPKCFIWGWENKIGTLPVSRTSTLVEHGGVVGKWIIQLSQQVSVSELANTTGFLQRQNSVVMPQYNACFWNLLIAALDPIDRVQPRSRTTCVGWLARSNGTAATHAVCLAPYHAAVPLVAQLEEASVKLEYNRQIPRNDKILLHWVFLILKVLIEDKHLPCLFFSDLCLFLCTGGIIHYLYPFLDVRYGIHFREVVFTLPFEETFLTFLPVDHQTPSSCDHQSGSCVCSSPKCAVPVLLNPPLPLPFSFAFCSFSFATFELTGLPTMLVVVPCPKTRSFIINKALLTSYFVSSPLSILIFRIVFDDEGSACTAAVSDHAERRILHGAFRRTE